MESDGIKSILLAEQEASQRVKEARDERSEELRKAREEARQETQQIREEHEKKFHEEFDEKSDDTAVQDKERINKMNAEMKVAEQQYAQNKREVIKLMLGITT